ATAFLERWLGWRDAVLVLAAVLAAVTIPCFSVGLGSRPSHEARVEPSPAHESASTLPTDAFRSRAFWLLTLAYLLNAVTTFAVAVHLVPYLRGRGFASGTAATALGAVGLVQVLGRSTFIRLSKGRP